MVRNNASNGKKDEEKTYRRLPKCVVPVHYDMTFQPEEQEPVLNGRMTIRVQVMCETKEIVLNGLNITVSDVRFTTEGSGEVQETKDILVNKDMETIQLGFLKPLQPGFGTLALEFEAEITDCMKGLYRTKNDSGRYNYITHFEPVHARRCFPCFDEPIFKATFDTTIIVPNNVVAISNMPVKEESKHEKNESLKVLKFQTTPKMSTYLIAMVIGDFEHIETTSKTGKLIRVFTSPGKKEQGHHSLNLAANLIDHFTEYFGVPYPLPKCDLVAIREFPIGGMENYGLITFVDTRLLVDPQESSAITKQFASLIVSHEVSHLWFGDLVTMKWWTDLWLKEGFAKFIEYSATHKFFPEFDVWTQFVSRIYLSALATDSLKNSHPVEVPVTNPGEIDEIFDAISYNKGSSIIKMMYSYIGDAAFRKGMKAYLEKFQFGNAETADLWEALEASSGKPVGKFMDTFTKQMGYPIVTVLDITNSKDGKTLTLQQEKFWADPKLSGTEFAASNANYKWIIPLTFCKESNPTETQNLVLFDGTQSDKATYVLPQVANDEWAKLNAGSVGFYRVRYPSEALSQFATAIKSKKMPPVDRLGLLDDVFACVKAGLSSTTDVLNLLAAFTNEDNYSVWSCIRDITQGISSVLLRTDLLDKFNAYCIKLFKPVKERLGWKPKTGESHSDVLLRALVISRLISFGDKETINEAEQMLQQHLKGDEKIPADLRTSVYRAVMSGGNAATLDQFMDMYRQSEHSEEKVRILMSLGSIKDEQLLRKILEFGTSAEVKMSDVDCIFMSMDHSKLGQDMGWQFFKDNIKLFQEKYPGGMLICAIVRGVTGHFVGDEFAQDIETFLTENPILGTQRTVQQVVEKIRINTAWLKRDLGCIADFLGSQ